MGQNHNPQNSTGLSARKSRLKMRNTDDLPGSRKFKAGHQPEQQPAQIPALVGGVRRGFAETGVGLLAGVGSKC
jgi:hypothetical protein